MLIKLDNAASLTKAIEIISELVTEVRIKFNEFGMSISAIDPANVAMVEFKLPKSAFSVFEATGEALGVNLDNLKRVLKRCGVGSCLVLESKENVLDIQIQDRIKRSFSLDLIEIDREDKEMPTLEFSSIVELKSGDFIISIEDCAVVSDACSFIVKGGKFIISAHGMGSAESEFSGDEANINAEECKSRYSLEYLSKFIKGAKLCEKTRLYFANDHPLKIEFKAIGMSLNFLLAPRVETED